MKKLSCVLSLFLAVVLVSAQSTNRAQLKSPFGLPVSRAAVPSRQLTEIAYLTIREGETQSLTEFTASREVVRWSSSTPSIVAVTPEGDISGVSIGNAFIQINQAEYLSIAVVPAEDFYVVSESQASLLPPNSRTGHESARDIPEYRTEPTFRLAYRFNNPSESKGASGRNGGIDLLGRGVNYEWLWTTYGQGGWFYDLNGVMREMVNGYQRDRVNGVELTLKPEFIYDKGVPYLQIRHILHNMNDFAVTGQQFGASADVMMHQNDHATLLAMPYGAYMADSEFEPTLELVFIGDVAEGISPVDTLWLGEWAEGTHVDYIYDDSREDVTGVDSAIAFSYQNIDLEPKETKEFIIRFTLIRNEDWVLE